jgi:hypothetical protein
VGEHRNFRYRPEAVNRRPSKQEARHMAVDGYRDGDLARW